MTPTNEFAIFTLIFGLIQTGAASLAAGTFPHTAPQLAGLGIAIGGALLAYLKNPPKPGA